MTVVRKISELRSLVRQARRRGRRIALVPTMGALHAAHESLFNAARTDHEALVIVSIYVNPTQFAPGEDFQQYPRNEAADVLVCERCGIDLVFAPPPEEMSRIEASTTVHVAGLTETLCGPHRPGHFDGVTTVVARLFSVTLPDLAYFGEKDAQQLAVIRRMVLDLDIPVEIVACPTLREPDGLAISSRNTCLNPQQRAKAPCLYLALCNARSRIESGEREVRPVIDAMRRIIDEAGPARIDYISIVDPQSMAIVERINKPVLVALAAHIGSTRLIDSITVDPKSTSD